MRELLKMQSWPLALVVFSLLTSFQAKSEEGSPLPAGSALAAKTYPARGVVREVRSDAKTIVIQHEAVSNYMTAMTMPFHVKDPKELAGLQAGDEVTFRLHVTDTESWVDQIVKTGNGAPVSGSARSVGVHASAWPTNTLKRELQHAGSETGAPRLNYEPAVAVNTAAANPLLSYKFTNELGQAVSLNDFRGQALGVTFFYTRCPLPDYCPRLSKNFEEASQKLAAMTNAPANWHFISITFDPTIDTPAMLRAYGESYHYDPNHWSILTGPPDKIAELAKACGVEYTPDAGTINHNFRTLIVNAAGHLQMVFPFTGNYSDSIVDEMLRAAAVTNPPAPPDPK
jgi:protein SCO1/2